MVAPKAIDDDAATLLSYEMPGDREGARISGQIKVTVIANRATEYAR